MSVNITFPVGRLVQGNLYKPNDKDANGSPLVVKTGPNAGQPRVDFYFAVAIAKGQEQHWNQTAWGLAIWNEATQSWPGRQYERPDFAWKIVDGDSQVPNKKGVKPCECEGFPGHWVLKFSSGYAPQIGRIDERGQWQQVTTENAVNPGDYIEVAGTVAGNDNHSNPGVYLNHNFVAIAGYGKRIQVGPDPSTLGFGQSALPAGASATPMGGGHLPAPAPAAAPAPAPAPAPMPAAAPAPMPPAPAAPAPAAPPPNPAILQPPAAAPAPAKQLTAKAGGATYDQLIGAGWTDEMLVQHGYMLG